MLNQHTPFDASAKSYSKELHLRLLERLLEIIIIQETRRLLLPRDLPLGPSVRTRHPLPRECQEWLRLRSCPRLVTHSESCSEEAFLSFFSFLAALFADLAEAAGPRRNSSFE